MGPRNWNNGTKLQIFFLCFLTEFCVILIFGIMVIATSCKIIKLYYKQVLFGEGGLNANTFLVIKYFKYKLCIWSLFYTLYFNLIPNISIVSIWPLTFQYHVNLALAFILWMKIDNVSNGQNKKLAFVDVTINLNFILAVCHVNNFHLRYNSID